VSHEMRYFEQGTGKAWALPNRVAREVALPSPHTTFLLPTSLISL
jgi:hypothetical protein